MIDVPQPVRTPILDDNGTPSRPWVMFFNWVYEKIRELAEAVAALQNSGSSSYQREYRVLDPTTVAAAGNFGTLDYVTYDEIILDLLVDRAMSLTDPTFTGGGGAVAARKGKRLVLLMTFTSAGTMQIFGTNIQLQPLGDQSVNTGQLLTQTAAAEWIFNEIGFAHLVGIRQSF